jgi:hypothetical protein
MKNFIFIPYWVESALKRNAMSLSDVLDYSKISTVLSQEEVASLSALQTSNFFFKENYTSDLFTPWRSAATSAQLTQLDYVISPMAQNKELTGSISSRLSSAQSPIQYDESAPKYSIVSINHGCVAVVLRPGFTEYIAEITNEHNFIVDLLKTFYVYLSVTDVSSLPIFRRYIQILESELLV